MPQDQRPAAEAVGVVKRAEGTCWRARPGEVERRLNGRDAVGSIVYAGETYRCAADGRIWLWLHDTLTVEPGKTLVVPARTLPEASGRVVRELTSLRALGRSKREPRLFWIPAPARPHSFVLAWDVATFEGAELELALQKLPFIEGTESAQVLWQRVGVKGSDGLLCAWRDADLLAALRRVVAVAAADPTARFRAVLRSDAREGELSHPVILVDPANDAALERGPPGPVAAAGDVVALAGRSAELRERGLVWEIVLLCEATALADPELASVLRWACNEREECGVGTLALPAASLDEEQERALLVEYARSYFALAESPDGVDPVGALRSACRLYERALAR
jgi:hypothetical protein